jgi:lysophospholipase L1-like esterase
MNKFWREYWESQQLRLEKLLEKSYEETQNKKFIYCIGDCLVEGIGTNQGFDYPAQLQEILGNEYKVINLGMTMMQMDILSSTFTTFFNEKLKQNGVICLLCGTNDLYVNMMAKTLFDIYSNFSLTLKRNHKIVSLTLLPRINMIPPDFEINRLGFNNCIREHYREFSDVLADIGNEEKIGYAGAPNDLDYYDEKDNTHLNKIGYGIVANIVYGAIKRLEAN